MINNSFKHSSSVTFYLNSEDSKYYLDQLKKQNIYNFNRGYVIARPLLDSSLISATQRKLYDYKMVQCGNYYQIYKYSQKQSIIDKEKCIDKKPIVWNHNDKNINSSKKYELKKIELKNINRSKISLQRLVKSNEKDFVSFITLTFECNLENIDIANKKFAYWRTYIKRKFKDFKYVCVPEFQKRGAVHYHLLTNISYDSDLLADEIKLWQPKTKKWQIGKPLKSWSYGYSMTKKLDDINVVAYITKYMTKEIDDRLFGYRRYFYSQNLIKPNIVYLNSDIALDYSKIFFIEKLGNLKYSNIYLNKYDELIRFNEYVC